MRRKRQALRIPRSVAISADADYEVVWVDEFEDAATLGECRPDTQQIVLLRRLEGPELVKTFVHELLHAVENEYDIKISHKAIHQFEEGLFEVLVRNGWLPAALFKAAGSEG